MAASQSGLFTLQQFSDLGALLVGGRLYTYTHGTTTFKTAYTDSNGLIPHTYTSDGLGGQYIALTARGELPAPLFLASGSYDIALKRADGSTVWTRRAEPLVDQADLAGDAEATDGAGMVGFLYSLAYATGTVGRWLKDLAASTGATFIGWIQSGTGAVLRTASDKMRDHVSVFDFMTAAEVADVRAGLRLLDVTAAIQAALDSSTGVFFPPGNYKTTAAIQLNDNNFIFGAGSATQFAPTHNGAFMAGKAVTPSSGTNVRRYNGGGQNFMIYGPGVASTSSIALDLRGCTAFKFWNVRILNFATGVRQGDNYSTYYNEFHACDISTTTIGYHNTTLGNGNKVFGGRLSACATCTLDSDNSGNLYNGIELEVFTTGHKTAAPTTQFIRYRDSRVENPPTSGTAFDIDPDSEDTQISGGHVVSVSTIITEVSAGVPTGRRTRVSLSEYESFYSGKKVSKHGSVVVTKDIASLAAGALRQESFTVSGVLTGDSVVFTAPVAWPAIVAGPCIVGGTDLVYMQLYNPTGSAIDPASMDVTFDYWRH